MAPALGWRTIWPGFDSTALLETSRWEWRRQMATLFYHSSFSFFNQLNVWRWSPSGHQKCIGMNCGCHHVASSPTGPIYCLRATHQPCTYESLSSNPYSNSTPSTLPRIQLLHTITTLINNSAVVASVPVGP